MSETAASSAKLDREAERIARELRIPPCPSILSRICAETRAPEPDLRKLSGLIGSDAALAAAMLRTVNSSYYGLDTKATGVQQALSILGLRASANLITGLLLRQAFPTGSGVLMKRFWDASTSVAETAANLASRIKGVYPDEAQTFALFRDCGIAVMIGRFSDYGSILDAYRSVPGAQVASMEDARYRFHHARVGYALARGWLLPEPLCQSILHHHDLGRLSQGQRDVERVDRKLVAFGLLADQVLALRNGAGLCPDWQSQEGFVLETLGIAPEDIVSMIEEAEPVPT